MAVAAGREADDRGPARERRPSRREAEEPPPEEDFEDDSLDLPDPLDDDESGDEASAKAGFHSIPTWDEAVGVMVSANLEARARRPGNGAASGRGGTAAGGTGIAAEAIAARGPAPPTGGSDCPADLRTAAGAKVDN